MAYTPNNRAATNRTSTRRPKPSFFIKEGCRFCVDSNIKIDYKNPAVLRGFLTERGKIMPRRITGDLRQTSESISGGDQKGQDTGVVTLCNCQQLISSRFTSSKF